MRAHIAVKVGVDLADDGRIGLGGAGAGGHVIIHCFLDAGLGAAGAANHGDTSGGIRIGGLDDREGGDVAVKGSVVQVE